jgi:hypothetical protein
MLYLSGSLTNVGSCVLQSMKSFLLVSLAVIFAGCASESPTAIHTPARYAAPDESARLRDQARANFERERERQGMGAAVAGGPTRSGSEGQRTTTVSIARSKPARTRWSAAEVRYAFAIGKTPSELTAGERAAAQSD